MNISKALGWAKTPAGIVAVVAAGAVGGLGAATYTLAQPITPASVVVHQVADTSTPTVEPVVVPTTVAPAPVDSTPAPAPVVAPTSEAPVAVKSPAPAPVASPAPKPYVMATGATPAGPPQALSAAELAAALAQNSPPGGYVIQPAPTVAPAPVVTSP